MSYRILIADDDAVFWIPCIGHVLEAAGFEIDIALTPTQCRDAIERASFDVVLLDICFDDEHEDGLGLLPEVRLRRPAAKVVMFSGLDDRQTVASCASLGAHAFVSKNTVSPTELWGRISELLSEGAARG